MNGKIKIIWIALVFMSCETVVNIDVPVEKPKLVVNSLFTPDSVWQVQISRNRHILNNLPFQNVEDAQVGVYDFSSTLIATLAHKGGGVYRGETSPSPGGSYTLKVETATEHNTIAISQIPAVVPITSVEVDLDTSGFQFNYQEVEMTVNFSDPIEKNYYLIKILREGYYLDYKTKDTVNFRSETNFTPVDPAYENLYDSRTGMLFNDPLFNGKDYGFLMKINSSILMPNDQYSATRVNVILFSVSEEYYQYFTRKNLQDYNQGDPFAQPVQVFTNVENGFGIFAGYTSSVYKLR